MRFWQAGDVVVDPFDLALGGNFTPGAYDLRFGIAPRATARGACPSSKARTTPTTA